MSYQNYKVGLLPRTVTLLLECSLKGFYGLFLWKAIKLEIVLNRQSGRLSISVEVPPDNHRTNLIKPEHLAGVSQFSVMIAIFPLCIMETLNLLHSVVSALIDLWPHGYFLSIMMLVKCRLMYQHCISIWPSCYNCIHLWNLWFISDVSFHFALCFCWTVKERHKSSVFETVAHKRETQTLHSFAMWSLSSPDRVGKANPELCVLKSDMRQHVPMCTFLRIWAQPVV